MTGSAALLPPGLDRRRLLSGLAVGGGAAALLAACSGSSDAPPTTTARASGSAFQVPGTTAVPTTLAPPSGGGTPGSGPAFSLFSQSDLDFQTKLILGGSGVNAAVGEVVTAVDQANGAAGGASYQSVYDAFVAMGNQLATDAVASLNAGHRVSARDRFLRAAAYYNNALFFVLGTASPDAEEGVYQTMNDQFTRAAQLMGEGWEQVAIPYEGSTLPGWFLKASPAAGGSGPRPTVIVNNGSDGQDVDLWSYGGQAAVERGYNALIFEGPGQGSQLFVKQTPFRYDWEKVITPVVDYLQTRSDVAKDKIALTGWSMGGYLVARAAAFEKRLAAVVTDPGAVDIYAAFPDFLHQVAEAGSPEQVNQLWAETVVPGSDPQQAFSLKKRLEIFSAAALREVRQGKIPTDWANLSKTIQQFALTPQIAQQITAPVLVTDYQDEQFYPGQSAQLMQMLTAPKTMATLGSNVGAQYHDAPMNPGYRNEVVFDWLDETLRP
ncbi:MAG: alpha/beta fold hydrolase [Acidimicrobiales bacterium]